MDKTSRRALLQLIPCLVALAAIMMVLGECSNRRRAVRETRRAHQQVMAQERRQKQAQLTEALQYLHDLPEVAWVEVDNNDIYMGFTAWPEDGELMLKGAALRGEKAIDFGCHAWAVPAINRGWRPGNGLCFALASARYGKVVHYEERGKRKEVTMPKVEDVLP